MERSDTQPTFVAEVAESLRVTVVAGAAVGILVIGVGSRLAMFALRLTSPDRVRGIDSDDGFEIGRFTLGGSYNLILLGALIGVIGAVAYRAVSSWLLGPTWFRRSTVALASGAVVGSILIEPHGIDFTFLKPTWFAAALFVGLPMIFGWTIGVAVESVAATTSWTRSGRRRWLVPVVLVAVAPFVLVVLAPLAAGTLIWTLLRRDLVLTQVRRSMAVGLAVRAAWMLIAVAGLAALLGDIGELRE